ncbi:MAG: ABC transporter ATP-binding protein [Bacteroidota bacterium]
MKLKRLNGEEMSNTAIKVENLSKQYRLGQVGTGTISHDLNRWWHQIRGKEDPYLKIGDTNDRSSKGNSEYVWALKNINFEVKQGEVLGIIGKNGAGKSTLLKILSKVTGPTTGCIKAKGRIASLLEVGTGFHPELTGRENIYLNGTILGMTKAEVKSKLDEIVDFAGVARYLDTPVKRFSSGMMVRLGFAVAAHLEPEILIVDEVLAVGDAEFQKKAIGKMKEVSSEGGRTVLFVSHNMASVRSLCVNSILLSNGQIHSYDHTEKIISTYLNNASLLGKDGLIVIKDQTNSIFNFKQISIRDEKGRIRTSFENKESIYLEIIFSSKSHIRGSRIVFQLIDLKGNVVFASTNHLSIKEITLKGNYKATCCIYGNLLNVGRYFVRLHAGIPNQQVLYPPKEFLSFTITSSGSHGSLFQEHWPGIIAPKLSWQILQMS